MRNARLLPIAMMLFLTVTQILAFTVNVGSPIANGAGVSETNDGSYTVDLGNGQLIEVGPGEALHKYVLTEQGLVEWVHTTDALIANEYGNATNSFEDLAMYYTPGGGPIGTSAVVPTGTGWEGHYVDVHISGLTENRTWVQNPGFTSVVTPWTTSTLQGTGTSSNPISTYLVNGHGTGDGCVQFEIDSTSAGPVYYYDEDDRALVSQTTTVNRGQVVWAGFRMDYWGDTQDDTHYGMTGSFALYVDIEGSNTYQLVFDDIAAEETWYGSEMIPVPTNLFTLPSVSITVGLWSKVAVGYTPEIGPRARIDNFELYLKTYATPANVNLLMNGQMIPAMVRGT
jgi:hypothetical protein